LRFTLPNGNAGRVSANHLISTAFTQDLSYAPQILTEKPDSVATRYSPVTPLSSIVLSRWLFVSALPSGARFDFGHQVRPQRSNGISVWFYNSISHIKALEL